jgi:hypothetical protein
MTDTHTSPSTGTHAGNGSAELRRSREEQTRFERRALETASIAELAGGATAAAFAIIALAGVAPLTFLPIACMVAGAALALAAVTAGRAVTDRESLAGGPGAELVGGAAALVLGLLSLIGLVPGVLSPVAAICLGCALFVSSFLPAGRETPAASGARAGRVGEGPAAVQGLVGVGAILLGVVSLVGIASWTTVLVALLSVGSAMILSAIALLVRAGFLPAPGAA